MAWLEEVATEVRRNAEDVATEQRTITYSELTRRIRTEPAPERSSRELFEILDKMSRQSDAEGKGMLSAVIVRENAKGLPGQGFFTLAEELGRDVSNQADCHTSELRRVHQAFQP
jgi:hypothetical protein